jgi:hypothetical protein
VTQLLTDHNTQGGKNTNIKYTQTHNGTQTQSLENLEIPTWETCTDSRMNRGRVIVNDEPEGMWEEVVVIYLKLLSPVLAWTV